MIYFEGQNSRYSRILPDLNFTVLNRDQELVFANQQSILFIIYGLSIIIIIIIHENLMIQFFWNSIK
jgi:hypothetical protein